MDCGLKSKMKKLVLSILSLSLALFAFLTFRASQFVWTPKALPPPVTFELDSLASAQRLAQAIKIPTITATSSQAFDARRFAQLRHLLETNYPKTHAALKRELINEHALLYRWIGSEPSLKPILLMAHQDVVPVPKETNAAWKHPPFAGVIEGGFIWGRGTLDVKSGLIGIMEAIESLLQEGFQPKRSIYLAFGHDEEIGGRLGAFAIAKQLEAEKTQLEFVLDEGGCITEGLIPGVESPVALIGIAEKGFVSLEFTVMASGGHSSMPPKALAIEIMSRAITGLYDHPFEDHMAQSLLFFDYVGPKMPFAKRIIFANSWLFKPLIRSKLSQSKAMNASIRTTIAPTIFHSGVKDNVLPSSAMAVVNFRIAPGDTIKSVIEYVRNTINDERIKIKIHGQAGKTFASEPSEVSPVDTASFSLIRNSIRAVAQDPEMVIAPYLVVGATDARYFRALSPNIYRFLFNRLGAVDLKRIHGVNERISVEDFSQTIRFYYQIMKEAQALP
jgi:carboxypeptidase PM20D1